MIWLKCCFTSTETVGLLGTGSQDGHLGFHTAVSSVYHDRVEVLLNVHRNRRFIRDGSPGRPPRLSLTQLLNSASSQLPLPLSKFNHLRQCGRKNLTTATRTKTAVPQLLYLDTECFYNDHANKRPQCFSLACRRFRSLLVNRFNAKFSVSAGLRY